jgi:hypothetical protein
MKIDSDIVCEFGSFWRNWVGSKFKMAWVDVDSGLS